MYTIQAIFKVENVFCGFGLQRTAAEGVLRKIQEHPDAWTRVDRILEASQSQQSKFFALQVPSVCI